MAVVVALVPTTALAQLNLSRLLGGLSKVANAQTEKEDPYQRLAEAAPSIYTLNGNWTYQSASFSYLGQNPLADIAIAQIDPIVASMLQQLKITPGSAKLRLSGGKGTITHGDHKLDGSYVVATVTAINDDEHKSLESVSAQIKTTLLREKKAAMLREKMQGATLEEVAEAAGAKIESFADAKVSD